jgi:hypothetical protein
LEDCLKLVVLVIELEYLIVHALLLLLPRRLAGIALEDLLDDALEKLLRALGG